MSRSELALPPSIRGWGGFRPLSLPKRLFLLFILLVALLLVPAAGSAAGMERKTLYLRIGCPTCDGEDGRTPRDDVTPIIAGQSPRYLLIVMKAYKSGERSGGLANLHAEVSDLLDDEQTRLVAEYVATLK